MSNQSFRCGSRSPAIRAGMFAVTVAMAVACLVGCSSDERANQMTSFSGKESKSETPALFTIPENQMSHVQVVTVQTTTLTRTLRLTGAVAYNNFRTTPIITQVSGPVSRRVRVRVVV